MRNLHAKLSDEAYEALVDFTTKHGITMTAYMEAIGLWLVEHPGHPAGGAVDRVVTEARRIDAERRARAQR